MHRWFCEPEGSKRKRILSEQQQRAFFQREFVAFEYDDLSPEQEEDLFARVQMGVQLNLAEKMRASTGPWQELAKLFVTDFPTVFSLMKDKARSKDFQLTLSCFSQIVECMHPSAANGVPTLKTNHTHLPKLLSNKGAVDDALRSHLASVWNTFKDLIDTDSDTFTNANKYLRGVQTFAPVEMVAVTVLISMYSETRNNRLLLGDIQAMRAAARENFADLRLNASIWRWFWEYIENLEVIRGAINGSTINRNAKQRAKKNDAIATGAIVAGSTAAAITAAAAAPKKGRFTARTRRPAETATEEAVADITYATVKQEQTAASMLGSPPLKRQRTEDSSSVLLPEFTHITPAEVRRQHLERLNGYQTVYRPPSPNLLNGLSDYRPRSLAEPLQAPVAPMTTGAGIFSSNHSIWLGGETQQPKLYDRPVASQAPLPGQPRSTLKASTSLLQSTNGKLDMPIDLTSDTEQERATLLSTFKTRPVSNGARKNSSKPTTEPTLQTGKSTSKELRRPSQELPNRAINPYAGFRNS